ncbi:hypothetical protein SELMODRAFT_416099 [Selaginella moellendorffii]|uniref:Uncharacterized protein n=1 Tax=Selaginella moellendorffii TaxID=88036 RepID=D8RY29_SELML|nr:hypothetical protein SELMODRAFT_416099 [Selaginella moellendorffii]
MEPWHSRFSREIDVRDKGAQLSGLLSRAKLPDPSMEVVLGMHYISRSAGAMKSRQELWDPEAFIRKFLVCGYNFADYAGGRTFQDTLYHVVDEVSGPSGSKLVGVRRIVANHSLTEAVDDYTLGELQSANILRSSPNSKRCDFLDPQLLLCADLRGQVVPNVTEQQGNVIPDVECEVDALMACGEWAVVCSMQRRDGLDVKLEIAWESCVSATGKMNASPKSVVVDGKPHAGAVLMEAKQILYVALSVIEGEPAISWGDVFFKEKPVTGLKLKLWDLVKDIEPEVIIKGLRNRRSFQMSFDLLGRSNYY